MVNSPKVLTSKLVLFKRGITQEASITGIKLAHGNHDSYHSSREKYEKFNILASIYVDDLIPIDQRLDNEIEGRLTKATAAFYMLRSVIWYRKSVSVNAKLRIFRVCVLPVLLYGSEVWALTIAQENRINIFYMKYLRKILGLNLGDRVSNVRIMEVSG
ncbi:unnamed protein product [Rotaria socialis]|uniref:Reverse transcriptase n=1 Tax=Rotaria socialis TaxID=392032 RepID=A0A821TQR6_9BILA|nr:unnamed protein product [Rotaria socialis]CAF4875235.1 unnamed protein product [Rotaria socialis]